MEIDATFDFRSDAGGKDPDEYSPTLRRYHQYLWSKPLPNGEIFELSDAVPGAYLHHHSSLGEFSLASDSVIPSFRSWQSMRPLIEEIPSDELNHFQSVGYTMGGMMIFPAKRIDGKMTLNGARGFTRAISDRMDLTLECIRRHYAGVDSPLGATLARNADFFSLFEDFRGYVHFFLLDDLVTNDWQVRFFMEFDDFRSPPVPGDVDTYQEYRRRSIDFVMARNKRIARG